MVVEAMSMNEVHLGDCLEEQDMRILIDVY